MILFNQVHISEISFKKIEKIAPTCIFMIIMDLDHETTLLLLLQQIMFVPFPWHHTAKHL